MTDLGGGREGFIRREHAFRHSQQRNRWPAELMVFLRADIPLRFPECIQHPHQRRTLSRKIMEIKQLKPAKSRRA